MFLVPLGNKVYRECHQVIQSWTALVLHYFALSLYCAVIQAKLSVTSKSKVVEQESTKTTTSRNSSGDKSIDSCRN